MQFVYVKIPLHDGVAERVPQVRDALDQALASQALGGLIGWGMSQADSRRPGPGVVPHHRLDIELQDQATGLERLCEVLTQLDCPAGTELHFTEQRVPLQRVWSGALWSATMPSTAATRPRRAG